MDCEKPAIGSDERLALAAHDPFDDFILIATFTVAFINLNQILSVVTNEGKGKIPQIR